VVSHLFLHVPEVRRFLAQGQQRAKTFIGEIIRVNYEREAAKRNAVTQPARGFFDAEASA